MIIIGRRGAAGLAPENTLEAMREGLAAGAHALHIDVRTTGDGVPVLLHDQNLKRTHGVDELSQYITKSELDSFAKKQPVPTLDQALDEFLGRTILVIEARNSQAAIAIGQALKRRKLRKSDWRGIIVMSFRIADLVAFRKVCPDAPIGLIHDNNPFTFVAYHRLLKFTAVGFHRLHTNRLAQAVAERADIFTFVYTANRPEAAMLAAKRGYDGVMTSYPDRVIAALERNS